MDSKEYYNLFAIYLRWCIEHDLMGEDLSLIHIFALHQSALVPLIHRVLSPHEKDDIWKYWIITCLVPLFSDESINCILSDIQRIAKSPTQGELREEVHEAAVIFLQNRLSKTGR